MSINRRSFLTKLSAFVALTAVTGRLDVLAQNAATTLPANMELVANFGLKISTGGKYHKPYVAVWVENAAGDVVKTISLWREQEDDKKKYLTNLRKWFRSAKTPDMTSSATRGPGQYSVVWDGTDSKGKRAPQGDYTLYIEAARETGPYQRVRVPLTLAAAPLKKAADDNGDLVNISAEYRAR